VQVIITNVTRRGAIARHEPRSFGRTLLIGAGAIVIIAAIGASFWSKLVWGYWFQRPAEDAALRTAARIVSVTHALAYHNGSRATIDYSGPPTDTQIDSGKLIAIYAALLHSNAIDRRASRSLTITEFISADGTARVHAAAVDPLASARVYRRSELVLAPPPPADDPSFMRLLWSDHYNTGNGLRWPQMFALILAGLITAALLAATLRLLIDRASQHRYRHVRGFAVEPRTPDARAAD